jgi:hypothetical protein
MSWSFAGHGELIPRGTVLLGKSTNQKNYYESRRFINIFKNLRTEKSEILFYPIVPDFQKNFVFWQVPRLRPFVLLVTATCRRRRAYSIGEILTRVSSFSLGYKNRSVNVV